MPNVLYVYFIPVLYSLSPRLNKTDLRQYDVGHRTILVLK